MRKNTPLVISSYACHGTLRWIVRLIAQRQIYFELMTCLGLHKLHLVVVDTLRIYLTLDANTVLLARYREFLNS